MVDLMNRKVLFVCWSLRPIHGTLLHALSGALDQMGCHGSFLGRTESAPSGAANLQTSINCSSLFGLISLLLRGRLQGFDLIYLQSTHPLNLCIALWARLHGLKIAYYLHEPTGFLEKIRKGDPLIYAALVRVTQVLECWFSHVVFVATPALVEKVQSLHLARKAQVLALPLAIPDLDSTPARAPKRRTRVLYLGRAHAMRCLDRFTELANHLHASGLGILPTMLTYNPVEVPSPFIDTRAGRSYTDAEMLYLLEESFVVWNVYDVDYSQSGVTPVALRSGVPLLVSRFEKETALVGEGVAFEVPLEPFKLDELTSLLIRLQEGFEPLSALCLAYFQRTYSPQSLIPCLEQATALQVVQGN